MNYFSKNNEGEILIKSPTVTTGYYKNPELTKEVLDSDGYFHTGDVGKINKNGWLDVIDRIKNLAKLSNGEYIAICELEMIYETSSFVQPNGLCIIADSLIHPIFS